MKIGIVVGFAIGYVLGAKAGRERYDQIKRVSNKLRQNPVIGQPLDAVGEKASDIVRIGGERVTDSIANAVKERMFGTPSSSMEEQTREIRVSESPISTHHVDRKS